MIVIVANESPDAVRGKLKLWCVEPKPNVFVSGINDALAQKVADLVLESCVNDAGLLIFLSSNIPPFYKIIARGIPERYLTNISGFQLMYDILSQADRNL